jgi:glycosyltransferase involved in cell wall biosynthesis
MLSGQALIDAYRAMDVFAFASKSETQGLVVTEAMAAKVPVVAIDAPGIREVVEDGRNGRLLPEEDVDAFGQALAWVASRSPSERRALAKAAFETAERFAMPRCAERALAIYAGELNKNFLKRRAHTRRWITALRRVKAEWEVLKTVTKATTAAVTGPPPVTTE